MKENVKRLLEAIIIANEPQTKKTIQQEVLEVIRRNESIDFELANRMMTMTHSLNNTGEAKKLLCILNELEPAGESIEDLMKNVDMPAIANGVQPTGDVSDLFNQAVEAINFFMANSNSQGKDAEEIVETTPRVETRTLDEWIDENTTEEESKEDETKEEDGEEVYLDVYGVTPIKNIINSSPVPHPIFHLPAQQLKEKLCKVADLTTIDFGKPYVLLNAIHRIVENTLKGKQLWYSPNSLKDILDFICKAYEVENEFFKDMNPSEYKEKIIEYSRFMNAKTLLNNFKIMVLVSKYKAYTSILECQPIDVVKTNIDGATWAILLKDKDESEILITSKDYEKVEKAYKEISEFNIDENEDLFGDTKEEAGYKEPVEAKDGFVTE